MERAISKPIIWEVNAPADEILSAKKFKTSWNSPDEKRGAVMKLRNRINDLLLPFLVQCEERTRRKYARSVKAAICVSEALAEYAVHSLGIRHTVVIPNGSDPMFFAPEKVNKSLFGGYMDYFKVIFSGASQWPWQGVDIVMRLAKMAKLQEDKILFIILNSTPSDFIRTGDNLLVFNRVNYFDVPAYLASADACLCLYHDFHWSRYGFHLSPLKLFDYMACERPVIASRLGQIAEVLEDGKDGLLTTSDPGDIYRKILFCFQYRDKANQMGKLAREKVIRFYNWERVARSTVEVFKSVTDE
jgi:glycosyltransferase involved in cell wall biosynthesis